MDTDGVKNGYDIALTRAIADAVTIPVIASGGAGALDHFAEAFTAASDEKWLAHPAMLKALGDRAFCDGVNRFIFHRYAMQPWKRPYAPGMTMGPWGVVCAISSAPSMV